MEMKIYLYSKTHETRTLMVPVNSTDQQITTLVQYAFPEVKILKVRPAAWSAYVDVEG